MPILEVNRVFCGYGDVEILHGPSIQIRQDEIVSIIGPNGAGKSTLLKTIMGFLSPSEGNIVFQGKDIIHLKPYQRVWKGIAYVPQLDNVFPSLTIEENLEMGAYVMKNRGIQDEVEKVYSLFPQLGEKRDQKAKNLSGGERQMLAMGKTLMTEPRVLLLDEPTSGLSPLVRGWMFEKIVKIHQKGIAIIIVEQNAYEALKISDRGYVLAMGINRLEDTGVGIMNNDEVKRLYLGGE